MGSQDRPELLLLERALAPCNSWCSSGGGSWHHLCPVRVPFGWHQAPGLVQHLIGALLFELRDTQVVIVQYLDDILFVGRDRLPTTQVAHDSGTLGL